MWPYLRPTWTNSCQMVCEGFSSCSTEIYGHENAEMQKRKFDDVTLQNSIVEFEE